jgi:hypothetical protein
VAEKAEPLLTGEGGWPDRLASDHDNFRAALRWSLDEDALDVGLRMAAALWRFWYLRGHLAEGRRWLAELLAAPGAEQRDASRGKALMAIGSIAYWQNDFEATRVFYEEGLGIFRELGDEKGIAQALYNLGFVALIEGDYGLGRTRYTESRALYERLSDPHGIASTMWGLSMAALLSEDFTAATSLAEETVRRHREIGDWYGQSAGAFVLYDVQRRLGNWDEVERMVRSQLEFADLHQDALGVAALLETMAYVDAHRDRQRRAVVLQGAAAALKESAGGGAPPALVIVPDARGLVTGRLSDEEIARAFEEGAALSLSEAVALLRKDPESG